MNAHEKLAVAVAEIFVALSHQGPIRYGIEKALGRHTQDEAVVGLEELKKLLREAVLRG